MSNLKSTIDQIFNNELLISSQVLPYKRLLHSFFSNHFTADPYCVVIDIFNSDPLLYVVSADYVFETINKYLNHLILNKSISPQDRSDYENLIMLNSKPLKDL